MRIDTISTFPHMYDSVMNASIMKRAQDKGIIEFFAHDLREWTFDAHHTTDDYPYGGGSGLVMMCAPIFLALESVLGLPEGTLPGRAAHENTEDTSVIFMAPHGKPFDDEDALRLSKKDRLVFVCGHYEGIDERAYALADEVISIGDYVLTSGELASMVVIDAVVRKIPDVLGAENGAAEESFSDGLLEFPQYTRPSEFREMEVPEVLLSGHHARIAQWRRHASLERTYRLRPDLIKAAFDRGLLSEEDASFLESLRT